jgi:hypothetical protein
LRNCNVRNNSAQLTNSVRPADFLDGAGETIDPDLLAEITANRRAIGALTHVFSAYAHAISV